MNKVLAVFAKTPEAGHVKTRLAASTSPEFAAQVATAFLQDTLARLVAPDAHPWLVLAPDDAPRPAFVTEPWRLGFQGEGDLGMRLRRFLQKRLDDGARRIVIVGADCPTLPVQYVEQAFAALDTADVVLGPATDGGYYLLGVARRLPPIFDGITWGTSCVLQETTARLDATWKLALMPPWYDVDTLDDWRMLYGHVTAMRHAGLDPGVPWTERLFVVQAARLHE